MSEFWDDGDASAFELPGDDRLAAVAVENSPEPEAAENTEPVPAADTQQPEAAADDTTERPRGPDGKFVAKNKDDEPSQPEPAAEPTETELILGKFKTQDDLAAAYQNLESHLGELRNDNGELRKLVEERLAAIEQGQQRPVGTVNWDDMIDDNPAVATHHAYEAARKGDSAAYVAYQKAIEAWESVAPGAPALWAEQMQMRNMLEERLQQIEERVAPAAKATAEQQFTALMQPLVNEDPGIGDFVQGETIKQLANEFPLVARGLAGPDPKDQVEAIKALRSIERGRARENLEDTTRDVARAAAEEAQKARDEAFVASPSASAGTTNDPAAEVAAQWAEYNDPLAGGWNI